MTEEHVWVTIGGKRLYVGKVPEAKRPVSKAKSSWANGIELTIKPEKPKRKRPQYSPPQEIFDAD